jgi:hypothetical protein
LQNKRAGKWVFRNKVGKWLKKREEKRFVRVVNGNGGVRNGALGLGAMRQ